MLQLHIAPDLRSKQVSTPARVTRQSATPFLKVVPRDPRLGCVVLAVCDLSLFLAIAGVVYFGTQVTGGLSRGLLHFFATSLLSFVLTHTLAHSYRCERLARMSLISRGSFILRPALLSGAAVGVAVGLEMLLGRQAMVGGTTLLTIYIPAEFLFLMLLMVSVAVERALFYAILDRLNVSGYLSTNVVVFGAGPIGQRLIRVIRDDYHDSVEIQGIFDDRLKRTPDEVLGHVVQGGIDDLIAAVKDSTSIDKVLIALPMSANDRILSLLTRLRPLPVDVALVPELVDLRVDKQVIRDAHPPFLNISRKPQSELGILMKRGFDAIAAATILVLLTPLLALAILAIKLDSPGPVLFRQPRMGFNNKQFNVLKFRTMYANCSDLEARQQTQRNDSRVTRVGAWLRRTSVDELPQLINVLRGDMSLVGPRPHALGMQVGDRLCDDIVREYAVRHRMKPGITGWAQVRGLRGAVEDPAILEARVHHDIYYIDNWSFLFDLWILLKTVAVLVRPKNAF
jgi:Undecaprenyl-phosphate glucose phosphotransferase